MLTTDLSTRYTGSDASEFATIALDRGSLPGCGRGTRGRVAGSLRRPWTPGVLAAIRPAAPAASGTAVPVVKGHRLCAAAATSFADVSGVVRRDDLLAITNPIPTDGVTSASDLSPPV